MPSLIPSLVEDYESTGILSSILGCIINIMGRMNTIQNKIIQVTRAIFGDTEVCNLCNIIIEQENVARLDVTVNDARLCLMMEELNPLHST
jgi:hypothetical protein